MKPKAIKDPKYIQYIETKPCYACGHIPIGTRKVYNEYLDKYIEKPNRNTAHHVDKEMTRTKNDHRVLPCCGHYTISGAGTLNCHNAEHSEGSDKSKEHREEQIALADEYYKEYCELKGIKNEEI